MLSSHLCIVRIHHNATQMFAQQSIGFLSYQCVLGGGGISIVAGVHHVLHSLHSLLPGRSVFFPFYLLLNQVPFNKITTSRFIPGYTQWFWGFGVSLGVIVFFY